MIFKHTVCCILFAENIKRMIVIIFSFEILVVSENIFLLLLFEDSFSIYIKKNKSNIKLITQFILISNKFNINYLFTFFDLVNMIGLY